MTAWLTILLRKMVNNKWLAASLLLGLTLTVALASSIPIYTNAILHRMLVKELERRQQETGDFAGTYWVSVQFGSAELDGQNSSELIAGLDRYMEKEALPKFGIPLYSFVSERTTEPVTVVPIVDGKPKLGSGPMMRAAAISDLPDGIELREGRLPSGELADGAYEVVVSEQAARLHGFEVGQDYAVFSTNSKLAGLRWKIVGIFTLKADGSLYWTNRDYTSYNSTFFTDFQLFQQSLIRTLPIRVASWYFAFDFNRMNIKGIASYRAAHDKLNHELRQRFTNVTLGADALDTFVAYDDKAKQLRTMMWTLQTPVLIMLGFYLYMVSGMIVERQRTEIAVMQSRGARRWQLVSAYAAEIGILGLIAVLIGPGIGWLFAHMLGSSNGFLEFVQRKAIRATIDADTYKYAIGAVAAAFLTILPPVFAATKNTIVVHKQQMARLPRSSVWHRFGFDLIALGITAYGYYSFQRRFADMLEHQIRAEEMTIDPLLFIVPALFIVGAGFFALRLFPWCVKLIYHLGRRWWPPSLYQVFTQIGRSAVQYQWIMVFIIIALATGHYSASAARTIERNAEDVIRYRNGADLALQIHWKRQTVDMLEPADEPMAEETNGEEETFSSTAEVAADPAPAENVSSVSFYTEPPFQPYRELPGVEHAAKVFVKPDAYFTINGTRQQVTLMGIDTYDFGMTAWMRDDLLPHHWYEYLNLISTERSAVLISKTLADQHKLKPGDLIEVAWEGLSPVTFVVYAVVDYFPGFLPKWTPDGYGGVTEIRQPNPESSSGSIRRSDRTDPLLIVGHLKTIQNRLALEPYEVWLKLKPDAPRQPLFDRIWQDGIALVNYRDTRQELIDLHNDPLRMAVNGVMTLGFLVSLLICFLGFLLYWLLHFFNRIFQFGVLRAIGLPMGQFIGMLFVEQLLITGSAIAIGMIAGHWTSRLFIPFLQLGSDPAAQIPPFQLVFDPRDAWIIYAAVWTMIIVGLLILSFFVTRIKLHQAVKLGEE
jgi:putative ABC transport system permease protein